MNTSTDSNRSILMLSIGEHMLENPQNDTIQRHKRYAEEWNGTIHMLIHSKQDITREVNDRLTLYGTGCSRFGYPLNAYRKGCRIVEENNIPLIYSQDPFGTALVGRWIRSRYNTALIVGNHSEFLDNPYWIRQRPFFFSALNQLARWNLPEADHCRVLNKLEKKKYLEDFTLAEERIHVRPTPPDVDQFRDRHDRTQLEPLRKDLDIPPDDVLYIWVGRPTPVKGLPLLFKAFRDVRTRHPDSHLLLIGQEKHAKEDLHRSIHQKNLSQDVTWITDGVPHEELSCYYQAADVYVHPSYYEGFGKTMVEAQVSQCPVITSNTGGGTTIVKDGETGLIVQRDNADELSKAMNHLHRQPKRRKEEMGKRGRKRCLEQFDTETMTKQLVEIWSRTINEMRTSSCAE
ncbi:MAG: glycosyltransferase family 4 protein [bacterium]